MYEQHLRTRDTAKWLTERGKRTSPSLLRKQRLMGRDDPGDHGPDWVRAPNNDCLYPVSALERYIDAWYARVRPMAAAKPPEDALEKRAKLLREPEAA